jgi:hypothetical protein
MTESDDPASATTGPARTVLTVSDLRERVVNRPARLAKLTGEKVSDLVARQFDLRTRSQGTEVLELTARHPHDTAGLMDFYQPGRWDSTADQILMSSIVQTGESPDEWEGTVGYVEFRAPAEGTYVVALNFCGYQQTMCFNGPWGVNISHTATTSDAGAVTAVWDGPAGETLYCGMTCMSDDGFAGIASLQSVQVFRLG